jgi:hypothetical protein
MKRRTQRHLKKLEDAKQLARALIGRHQDAIVILSEQIGAVRYLEARILSEIAHEAEIGSIDQLCYDIQSGDWRQR